MPEIIDGRKIANEIKREVAASIESLAREKSVVPHLVVLLVGNDPASEVYVKGKAKTAQELGIHSETTRLPSTVKEDDVLRIVDTLNENASVHGILVQLPLPPQLKPERILEQIHPSKDVDGLHPANLGLLAAGRPRFIPCTPYGVWELLKRTGHSPSGKEVLILGRSNLVGRPLALLLSMKARDCNATVTVCHSQTPNIAEVTRRAEILVSAIGHPHFVTADMIRPGAVVIDVGIHRREDGKLAGDVDFDAVLPMVSAITPVPGGVGPMTIAMLMHNTLQAAQSA
ncbi:MAG: bifunctional 5,10-methylenetetrahydrofolate dehydrogenase/5,10-methenyltetrahydrofolate cyclohydrolase [bacterium]